MAFNAGFLALTLPNGSSSLKCLAFDFFEVESASGEKTACRTNCLTLLMPMFSLELQIICSVAPQSTARLESSSLIKSRLVDTQSIGTAPVMRPNNISCESQLEVEEIILLHIGSTAADGRKSSTVDRLKFQ